jgi:hypothetical protein
MVLTAKHMQIGSKHIHSSGQLRNEESERGNSEPRGPDRNGESVERHNSLEGTGSDGQGIVTKAFLFDRGWQSGMR